MKCQKTFPLRTSEVTGKTLSGQNFKVALNCVLRDTHLTCELGKGPADSSREIEALLHWAEKEAQ